MKTTIIGIISLGLVATLYESPYLLLCALLFVAGSWYYFSLQDTAYLKVFFFTACFGPAAEIVAIHAGAWQYTMPQLGGIPVWLPALWGLAGMFIVRTWLRVHNTK